MTRGGRGTHDVGQWYNGTRFFSCGAQGTLANMDSRRYKKTVTDTGARAKQISLEVYRKALKSVREQEWRWKHPPDPEGWVRVALVAFAAFLGFVVNASGGVAGAARAVLPAKSQSSPPSPP